MLVIVNEAGHEVSGVDFLREHQDPETRRENVKKAMDIKKVTIPTVMDNPDASMEKAYKAFPYRVVGVEGGQVAFNAKFDKFIMGMDIEDVREWLDCEALVQERMMP